jgi:hypothetical protein
LIKSIGCGLDSVNIIRGFFRNQKIKERLQNRIAVKNCTKDSSPIGSE